MRAHRLIQTLSLLVFAFACCLPAIAADLKDTAARERLVQALTSTDQDQQIALIRSLSSTADPLVAKSLAAWRQGGLFLSTPTDATKKEKQLLLLDSSSDANGRSKAIDLITGEFISDPAGTPATFATTERTVIDTSSKLRRAIKSTLDVLALNHPNPQMRRDAVMKLASEQNADYLQIFAERLKTEPSPAVRKNLAEAIAISQLASSNIDEQIAAATELNKLNSLAGLPFLKELHKTISKSENASPELVRTCTRAVRQIEQYQSYGTMAGTAFRGLSLSAVLLVVALGLAITFGLMGVINMAHGEMMMLGAYATFAVQKIFGAGLSLNLFGTLVTIPGANAGPAGEAWYFLAALPVAFIIGASAGMLLERGVIRFLYARPLESLLATWGVSLVLQQLIRGIFGPANVQVNSPSWLSGGVEIYDVPLAYNRLFVLGFAVLVVVGTWLLLTRTPWGLQMRAVMQNRRMASCLGIKTERINILTFAFGSGLAGVAGACLSQISNVGPSLGQSYIVDSFMIVTLGGVGSLVGTVAASLGIGVSEQILQPFVGAVLGKVLLLIAIILFLQWRPAGMFVTKSRSLD